VSPARLFPLLILLFAALSCGDSAVTDAGPDGGDAGDGGDADAGPPPTCDESTVPTLEIPDPVGHADPLGSAPGEARAGRIAEADLPIDPESLETWDDGDYVLANDHVAVLIEQAGDSQLYDPWGGKLVGIFTITDACRYFGQLLRTLFPRSDGDAA